MLIPSDHALRLLEFYRTHQTKLALGGKILGEEATCVASIRYVWPESNSVGITLMSDDGEQRWERIIRLERASFRLFQIGDVSFAHFVDFGFQSILIIAFSDGTTMFMADQAPAAGVPKT